MPTTNTTMFMSTTKNKDWLWFLALMAISVVLLYLRYPSFFSVDSGKVLASLGEGYKAYTVIQYHVVNDETYSAFEGMNYPYGEHVIPGACQPVLSNTLKLINQYGLEVPAIRVIDFIHWSMLLSFLCCIVVLYLIFRKLNVVPWIGMVSAIGITFLAPQTLRMIGHYGLAHPEVIPLALYFLIVFEEGRKWWATAGLLMIAMVYAGIHLYSLAMLASMVLLYFMVRTYWTESLKQRLLLMIHPLIIVGIPVLWYTIWMDQYGVIDRTAQPWGFFDYRAKVQGLLMSHSLPFYQWIDQHVWDIKPIDFESSSYIGLLAIMGTLGMMIYWLINEGQTLFSWGKATLQPFLVSMSITAVLIMLMSLGLPFIIPGLEWLLDYSGPLRQFRAIGRFAWVCYFTINVVVITFLAHWWRTKPNGWRTACVGVGLLVLCTEAYQYNHLIAFEPEPIAEWTEEMAIQKETGLNVDDYQAILPVPYFNIGSDMFWYGGYGAAAKHTLTLSVQHGIPTTGALLTRTSISQTIAQLQLVSEPYRIPQILADYPNEQPLLMVWENQADPNPLLSQYGHLLEGSTPIGKYKEDILLYKVPLLAFKDRITARKKALLEEFERNTDVFYQHGTCLTTDSVLRFVYEGFDTINASRTYLSPGGGQGKMRAHNLLFKGAIPNQVMETYRLGFWVYIAHDMTTRADLIVKEYDENGAILQTWQGGLHRHIWTIDNNGWALFEMDFTPKSISSQLEIFIQDEELGNRDIWYDELLIRLPQSDIYQSREGMLWKNNRHFLE